VDADRAVESLVGGDEARPSSELHDFTAAWEGSRLVPYQDGAGYWTIGRGHKMQPTDPHVAITLDEQDALFVGDLLYAADGVARLIFMPLPQCKFDALVDFAFHFGLGALAGSTLRKRVNGGYFDDAAAEFGKWNNERVNGVLVPDPGLTKRCSADRAIFASADYTGRP
jgi:lysozyme